MKLLCKGDIFSVDRRRAFQKIKEDMVTEPGAWLREVMANAIDAQNGIDGAPAIEVTLQRGETGARELTVADAGEGMTDDHLLAFHFMGRTTKRTRAATADALIGRFGLGFISVFAARNGVRGVTIVTRPPGGRARRIDIRVPGGDALPEWRETPAGADAPVRGTRFTFALAADGAAFLERQIAAFCAETIVPVRYAGQVHRHTARELAARDGERLVEAGGNDGRVTAWCAVRTSGYVSDDSGRIYLRDMPAERGSAHLMFENYGDKMAQNCGGRPYLPAESIVVSTRIGEPTLARDKLLRNADFGRIKAVVTAVRAHAVADLLTATGVSASMVRSTCRANLYTLQSHLAAHLEGREVPADLAPAVKAVARQAIFEVYESFHRFSLAEIYRMRNPKHAVFLHARGHDVAAQFFHTSPVTLKEDMVFDRVFGGYTKRICADLLAGVFGNLSGAEPRPALYAMEDVLSSTALATQMEEKGVISRQNFRVESVDIDSPKMREWFEAVRSTLNKAWFRNALSTYNEIRTIRLLPVRVVTAAMTAATEVLAMLLNVQGAEPDEVTIGVRVDSDAARALAAAGTKRELLLPAVVQIASCISKHHFGRFVLNQDNITEMAFTQELLIESVGLEDRVIHRALRNLYGGEDEDGAEADGCVLL